MVESAHLPFDFLTNIMTKASKSKSLLPLLAFLLSRSTLAGELGQLTPEQLVDMQKNGNALVVDIRTAAEWQSSGVIADSLKLQSFDANGKFDQENWLNELKKAQATPDQPIILVCRSGNRSTKVGELLTKQMGFNNVYHLNKGISGWAQSGQPLTADCPQPRCK